MKQPSNFDFPLFYTAIGLIVFGLVMISSVSIYESYLLTSRMVANGQLEAASNDFYLWRHLAHVCFVIPFMVLVSKIHYSFWKKMAPILFVIALVLLILVLIPALSNDYGTARSWLNVGVLPSFQPSELGKFALICYLALWMDKKMQSIKTFQEGFLPFVVLLSILVFLIAVQPDFGAVLVLVSVAGSIFFVAGGNLLHIFLGGGFAFLVGLPVILSHEYIKLRFLAFLDPTLDPQGAGYHIMQSLMTIGSGQWFGVGFGNSVQKFGYLPEVQGDTIFAIAAEEFGFVRILLVLLAYLYFAYRGYQIAMHAPDRFSQLLATGITSWVFFQTCINIAVNMSLFPLTGLTLPFISYGGSSLLMITFAVGVLLNISRYAKKSKTSIGLQWRGLRRSYTSFHSDL